MRAAMRHQIRSPTTCNSETRCYLLVESAFMAEVSGVVEVGVVAELSAVVAALFCWG